jgi:hypothetical protein
MRYLRPEIISCISNLHLIAESQYVVGIIPDPDGCPTVAFSEATGSGTISIEATYELTINYSAGSPCQGTSNMTGTATFEDNVLVPDCSNASFSCDFVCQNTSQPTGGEICMTSLTLNGVPQDADVCVDVPSELLQAVGGTLCPQ